MLDRSHSLYLLYIWRKFIVISIDTNKISSTIIDSICYTSCP